MKLEPAPFVWGQTDCAAFVCRIADETFGTDLSRYVVGQYSCAGEAARRQARHNPISVLERCGYKVGADGPIRSGDILLGTEKKLISLSFVWAGQAWSSAPVQGVFSVPVNCLKDWSYKICRLQHQQ